MSYSGLSPANDTGAKKKKKKQKKKKEKGNETDSAQDQPVKVTRRLCFLGLRELLFQTEEFGGECIGTILIDSLHWHYFRMEELDPPAALCCPRPR